MRRLISLLIFFSMALIAKSQHSLSDYQQMALKNSPVFINSQNKIQAYGLDSLLIEALGKPNVNLTSSDFFAPVVNGYGYDEIITNRGNYNAFLGVNYTIIGKNNRNNQFSSLNIQKQIIEASSKLNERDLGQAVATQYISVYGAQQLLLNTQAVIEILNKEEKILKKITEDGIYNQTDYLSFLVNYKQQQLSFEQLKLQTQSDLFFLNYLCGNLDTAFIYLDDPGLAVQPNIGSEKTIQFRLFFLDSLELQNSIEQVKFKYKPKINLFGDVGYNTSFQYNAEKNFGASAGLNFSLPIYDGSQRKIQLQKLNLSGKTRLSYIDFYRKQYTIKQMQLMKQISGTEKLIEESRNQLNISESLLNVNNKLLEIGSLRITDYILSLTNYMSSKSTLQQLFINKLQLINQFNYLNY